VQYPGEASPRRFHELNVHIPAFWIDTYPVTNSEFKKFLDATDYHPRDDHNSLRDWKNGNYPSGWQDKPVTWVSLDDARAYAAWAGKRLPHEWEWQYVAQGNDHRDYPWGNEWVPANAAAPDKGRIELPPSDVQAHPGAPARLEHRISSGMFGNGRMSGQISTLVPQFFAAAATTSPADRNGIFRRPINCLNMESIC
jgi:formylglycine-generating enzyme required for sulfatase activity